MVKVKKVSRERHKHFLREWRDFLGLTQIEAAEKIGTTQSILSRVERGETPYEQDFLEKAAEAYGTTTASLLSEHPQFPIKPIRGEREIYATLRRIEGLHDTDIELALGVIMNSLKARSFEQE